MAAPLIRRLSPDQQQRREQIRHRVEQSWLTGLRYRHVRRRLAAIRGRWRA